MTERKQHLLCRKTARSTFRITIGTEGAEAAESNQSAQEKLSTVQETQLADHLNSYMLYIPKTPPHAQKLFDTGKR